MKNNLFAACVVALGLALAGMFIYLGFRSNAQKDRAVVVKGLSTRDVQADYAVWPLSFGVHSNDLPAAYKDLNQVTETVKQFLIQIGWAADDKMRCPPPRIRLGFCRHPVRFWRRKQPQRQHKIVIRPLRFFTFKKDTQA